jgi:hypothetical protein
MSSLRFAGVLFTAYPNDHLPRHVHGFSGGTHVIVELGEDRRVRLADRKDHIDPPNAKRNVVKKVLETASDHFGELVALWESMRGQG